MSEAKEAAKRLREADHEDFIAEGCQGQGWKVSDDRTPVIYPAQEFERLWKDTYGDESLDANPWVWAITFKVVKDG